MAIHEQQDFVGPTTYVEFRGERIKVSVKEMKIMWARGHLTPVYNSAPIVSPERGFVNLRSAYVLLRE